MPVDRNDESWIGPLLSRHADQRELDLDAFVTRVVTEAATSRRRRGRFPAAVVGGPAADLGDGTARGDRRTPHAPARRRRLRPVLVAAASVFTVAVAASSVTALTRWNERDDRTSVIPSSPSPTPRHSELAPATAASAVPQPSAAPPSGTPTSPTTRGPGRLAPTFQWRSEPSVVPPRVDVNGATGFKDASVVHDGGRWHMFVTVVSPSGYGLGYLSFSRWADAASAPVRKLASSPMGPGFRAAPQVFYFAPQKLWYLVYETGRPSYSTNPDLSNPNGWSAPRDFYSGIPASVRTYVASGFWIDPWVICDDTTCYLYSSDNRGHLFRSQTPKASFPNGMDQPVVAAQDTRQGSTFAAGRVYRVSGTGQYLLLSQAFGPDGHAYLRSWTAASPAGPWTSLASVPAAPFAGAADISPAGPLTSDIARGELIRSTNDETLTVNPCQLQLLYLALDNRFQDNRTFQIALLTQTNSVCR